VIDELSTKVTDKRLQADIWCNLGNALRDTGMLLEALSSYKRGFAIEPNNELIADNMKALRDTAGDSFNELDTEAIARQSSKPANSGSCGGGSKVPSHYSRRPIPKWNLTHVVFRVLPGCSAWRPRSSARLRREVVHWHRRVDQYPKWHPLGG
jgi:hypothetical protein